MTADVSVVVRVDPRTGDMTRIVGVYTNPALARRVTLRTNNSILITGPIDREWGRPK